MMTKKDYEGVAKAIRDARPIPGRNPPVSLSVMGANAALQYVAQNIADYAVTRDRRFDRERFLKACGVTS